MKIAVTGANGFVGAEVCRCASVGGHEVMPIQRDLGRQADLLADVDSMRLRLSGAQAVVHLAARAHVINARVVNPIDEFRRVNVQGAINVAKAAVDAGVRRFVFVSSIGVLGNTSDEHGLSEQSNPAPVEPYAVSKWEAELALTDIASRTQLELVIVRPPLVYGPRVRGNFLRLLKLVSSGIPLPLGSVRNVKSFIGVSNLADALMLCAVDSRAAGHTFVVSDGEEISLPDLLRLLAKCMDRPFRVFPFPPSALAATLALVGRSEEFSKLARTLRVDPSKICRVLGWRPNKDLHTGIGEMVDWYRNESQRNAR